MAIKFNRKIQTTDESPAEVPFTMTIVGWKEVTLSVGDTIVGLIRGQNAINEPREQEFLLNKFYDANGQKNFIMGDKVSIPLT